jgi:hypothetical protein
VSRAPRLLALVCAASLAGCLARPHFLEPAPRREFGGVLSTAQSSAAAGDYANADRALAQFSARYPGSREAADAAYYRALYQLDPANHAGSLATGVADLDQLLAADPSAPHASEAQVLRRIAAALQESTRLTAAAMSTQTSQTAAPGSDRAKDDEIAHLKDALAKATDELDRIKKRLTTPIRP